MSIQQLHAQAALSAPPTPAEIEQFVHEMGVLAAAHLTPEQQVQFALNGFMVGRVAKALEAMLAPVGPGMGAAIAATLAATLAAQTTVICPRCTGHGRTRVDQELVRDCTRCKGSGVVATGLGGITSQAITYAKEGR